MAFAPIEDLVEEIARGQMVIMVDGPERENEGDLLMAAHMASAEAITFMAKSGSGLICAPLIEEQADHLDLPLMTDQPSDPRECKFTISVDARTSTTTGISAHDRAHTARLLANPHTRADDFRRPGHLFPLRARAGGVLERPGHTEAAIDLARMAGCPPVGLICEVMNDDGTMARLPELERLAEREGLLLGSIADLIEYRRQNQAIDPDRPLCLAVRALSAARLPTPLGVFDIYVFQNLREEEIVVLKMGDLEGAGRNQTQVLTRIHSACFTGDVLGSLRCDCGGQLQMALDRIGNERLGLVIYLPQEGRGIGLAKKVEAYFLQQQGLDTVEANHELGFPADLRSYEDAAAVLSWFGVSTVRLLTNNPAKIEDLERLGIQVTERLPLEPGPGPVNLSYLKAKKGKLGHLFEAV